MSFDGGFGAVVYVREGLVNDVLKAIHFRYGDAFRAAVSRTLTLGGVTVEVSGEVYAEAPQITLRAVDARARVALSGWARVRLHGQGTDEVCIARLTSELLVPIVIDAVEQLSDKVYLDLSQFEIASASVAVPWVSTPVPVYAPHLTISEPFRQLLLDAVRPMAKKLLRVIVPMTTIDQMQRNLILADIPFAPTIRPQGVAVMDGALAVGFDLFDGDRKTTGSIGTLEFPSTARIGNSPIVVALQPAMLLHYGQRNLQLQTRLVPFPPDKRIDGLALDLVPGAAKLGLDITDINDDPFPDGHIGVSVLLQPEGDYVRILSTEVVYLDGGLVGLVDYVTGWVTDYVRSVVKQAVSGAVGKANWALSSAKYVGELPGAAGSPGHAIVKVRPRSGDLDPGFALFGVDAEVYSYPDPVYGDRDVLPGAVLTSQDGSVGGSVNDWRIRERHLRYDVPDHPLFSRDPSLRTRFSVTVHRQDGTTGEFIQEEWSDVPGARTLMIDLWSEDYYLAYRIEVLSVHFRPATGHEPDLEPAEPIQLRIHDPFRRDFPYVRWYRYVTWVKRVVQENGIDLIKPNSRLRSSAVHKTDIRQRCEFCDTGKLTRAYDDHSQIQALATLPAPAEERFRTELCEFCFGSD